MVSGVGVTGEVVPGFFSIAKLLRWNNVITVGMRCQVLTVIKNRYHSESRYVNRIYAGKRQNRTVLSVGDGHSSGRYSGDCVRHGGKAFERRADGLGCRLKFGERVIAVR
jgi:hypothetical protein